MIIFLTDSFPLCLIYLKAGFRVCGKFNLHLLIFACLSAAVPDRGDPQWQEEKPDPKVIRAVFQTSQPNSEAIFIAASTRVRLCPLASHIWPSEFILEQRGKMMARRFPVWEQQQCLLQSCSPPPAEPERRALCSKEQNKVGNFLSSHWFL